MHLVVYLPPHADDVALARRSAAAGLGLVPVTPWALKTKIGPGLLLNFSNIRPAEAMLHARRLREALGFDRKRP